MQVRAETTREGASPPVAERSDLDGLRNGRFDVRFRDERSAKAAARDARAVGFVVDVYADGLDGWLIGSRRKHAFAADDGDRYASRLRAIAAAHGGAYERFVIE